MDVVKVNKDNFDSEVVKSDLPVLIDFNAGWCGPCRMLSPILDLISSENENVKIVSIDVDDNEELAKSFGVSAIPCLVLYKNGKEDKRNVGLLSKSEIEKFIGE